MRKEVLCALFVLAGGWAQAQQPYPGYANQAYYQGHPAAAVNPAAYYSAPHPGNVAPAAAWMNGAYPNAYRPATVQTYGPLTAIPRNPPPSGPLFKSIVKTPSKKAADAVKAAADTTDKAAEAKPADKGELYNTNVTKASYSPATAPVAEMDAGTPADEGFVMGGAPYEYGPAWSGMMPVSVETAHALESGFPYWEKYGRPNARWRSEKCWASAGYKMAWFRPGPLATPLVTTGSGATLSPGSLGQPDTAIIFGPGKLDFNLMHGFEGEIGMYLDPEHRFSVDAGGFYILPGHIKSFSNSDELGNPVIARPVLNGSNQQEESYLTSLSGSVAGSTQVDAASELWSAELNGRFNVAICKDKHCDFFTGFRMARLYENLTITDKLRPLMDNFLTFRGEFVNAPFTLEDEDQFTASTRFYGMNFGARYRWHYNWFSMSLFGKTAIGLGDESVRIRGQTSRVSPGGRETVLGGILAQPSNIGTRSRTVFGVIPEGGVNFGVDAIDHIRITCGYSFLFWNKVVRPGNHIDRIVDPGQVPSDQQFGLLDTGMGRPGFTFRDQAFWAHMFNFGCEFYY